MKNVCPPQVGQWIRSLMLVYMSFCNVHVHGQDYPSLPVWTNVGNYYQLSPYSRQIAYFCPLEETDNKEIYQKYIENYKQCPIVKSTSSTNRCKTEILPIIKKKVVNEVTNYSVEFRILAELPEYVENDTNKSAPVGTSTGPSSYDAEDKIRMVIRPIWLELYNIYYDQVNRRPISSTYNLYGSFLAPLTGQGTPMDLRTLQFRNDEYELVEFSTFSENILEGTAPQLLTEYVNYKDAPCEACQIATQFDFNIAIQTSQMKTLWDKVNQRIIYGIKAFKMVEVRVILRYDDKEKTYTLKSSSSKSLSVNQDILDKPNSDDFVKIDPVTARKKVTIKPRKEEFVHVDKKEIEQDADMEDPINVNTNSIVDIWTKFLIPEEAKEANAEINVLAIYLCKEDCEKNVKSSSGMSKLNAENIKSSVWKNVAQDLIEKKNLHFFELSYNNFLKMIASDSIFQEFTPNVASAIKEDYIR